MKKDIKQEAVEVAEKLHAEYKDHELVEKAEKKWKSGFAGKAFIIVMVAVIASFAWNAFAGPLNLPSGHVISGDDGAVVPANETSSGMAHIAEHGYVVGGGVIYVEGGGMVTVADFVAASPEGRRELIGSAYPNISDEVAGEISADVAAAVEQGVSDDLVAKVLDAINDNGGVVPSSCPLSASDCATLAAIDVN